MQMKTLPLRITVYKEVKSTTKDWPGDKLIEVIDWLTIKLFDIPEEFRREVICEFKAEAFDEPAAIINIYYYRQPTEEEIAIQQEKDQKQIAEHRKQELETLHRLKAKYEG